MADTRYALGFEISTGQDRRAEVALIERMADRMYADARELRQCRKPLAASALESAAFGMVGNADNLRRFVGEGDHDDLPPEATG